jgi:hypothetical protein
MPYGDQYVATPESAASGAYPSAYVYAPAYGWTWLAAPWVWNYGPSVYFGIGGPRHYGWYRGYGYGHGYGGRYYVGRGYVGRGYVGRGVVRGPVIRGGGGFRGHVSGGHFGGGHVSGHAGGHGRH